jgi:putative membrane protein
VEDKREGKWTVGLRSPVWAWTALLLVLTSILLALLAFGPAPGFPYLSTVPLGGLWSGAFLFIIALVVGSLFASQLAQGLGGKFPLRRAFIAALLSAMPLGAVLVGWRVYTTLFHPFPVEGVLLAGFGLTLWLDTILVAGIAGPNIPRSLPAAIIEPLLGMALTLGFLGFSLSYLGETLVFFLLPLGAGSLLLYATDRPLKREFGLGSVSIVRPLFDHINDRDPEGSRYMEDFFSRASREGDLNAAVLAFGQKGHIDVLWLVPSVHPGPFAEIGASDLPHKLAFRLSSQAKEVIVPHTACTHDQNLPTTEDVELVAEELRKVTRDLSFRSNVSSTPLLSPHPGSVVRAQALGDAVVLVVTQAPAPSDDLDYAVGEMLREEAIRRGYSNPIVVDAHNSFTEADQSRGSIPFGSPASTRVLEDARAALDLVTRQATVGPLRVGFARKSDFTVARDGLGREGLAVTVIEAGGKRTAYVLFDGNNLVQGYREKLLQAVAGLVDACEVMTTDNHVVHEVEGGLNPIGRKRSVEDLTQDLKGVLEAALENMAPAEVASAKTMVHRVRILGPGVTFRLMTALTDSFHIFWMLFLATFLLAVSGELLVLALVP